MVERRGVNPSEIAGSTPAADSNQTQTSKIMTSKTINRINKAVRIVLTVTFVIFALACLYAIIALHRPEHIITTAGYTLFAILPWIDND